MKYRKKLVAVEAVQLLWSTWGEMCDFAGVGRLEDGQPQGCFVDENGQALPEGQTSERMGLYIPTLEGLVLGVEGDYIIRGTEGELYPCKPDAFEATYEPLEEVTPGPIAR